MKQLLAKHLASVQVDQVLTAVAGCISLSTALQFYRNEHVRRLSGFTVGGEHLWNRFTVGTVIMACLGVMNIFTAAARFNGYCKFNFNKYLILLVGTLMCNFTLGIFFTDYRGQLPSILEKTMKPRLYHSLLSEMNFGVGFVESDNWDFLQLDMRCCGVDSYQDYLVKQLASTSKKTVPMSCCKMKPLADERDTPVAANPSQCMLDAKHKATESVFLNVQGCKSPLTRTLTWQVARLTAMLFAAICLQAVALLYLSWLGFQTTAPPSR